MNGSEPKKKKKWINGNMYVGNEKIDWKGVEKNMNERESKKKSWIKRNRIIWMKRKEKNGNENG